MAGRGGKKESISKRREKILDSVLNKEGGRERETTSLGKQGKRDF